MFRGSRTSLSSKKYRAERPINTRKTKEKNEKNVLIIFCFLWPLLKGNHALFMGREHYFWFPKPGFNLYSEENVADHKKGWKVYTCHNGDRFHSISLKSVYCPCGNSTQCNYRINKSMIVFCIHLAVWNNVCSRFRGIEYKKIHFICWLIVKKKPAQPLFMGHFPW